MIRTWKRLGLTATLAVVLTAGRGAAQTSDPAPASQLPDGLRQEVEQFRGDTIRSFQAAKKEIDALKEEIAHLRKDLDEVRNAKPSTTRISAYPPAGAAVSTGTIRLSNTYPANVTIVVNGEGYTLAPGETRVLAGRPAGTFTYEVVGVRPAVERSLVAGGTFPIQVHP